MIATTSRIQTVLLLAITVLLLILVFRPQPGRYMPADRWYGVVVLDTARGELVLAKNVPQDDEKRQKLMKALGEIMSEGR